MIIDVIIISICLIALIIASINDIRTREVPDWISYGLIFAGIGLRLIYSTVSFDWWYILYGLAGLFTFFGIGMLMFYTGQWGGGDSKIIMGLGAMLGINFMHYKELFAGSMLIGFLINLLLIGALYGLLWSIIMAVLKWSSFIKEFSTTLKTKGFIRIRKIALIIVLSILLSLFFVSDTYLKIITLSFSFILLLTLYMWPFVKSVEKICMYKMITPDKLTEGDWIAENVNVAGQLICGPKDLGIEKKQIAKLIKLHKNGKVSKIRIKEGIPFIPSFLIAFVITIIWGNLLALVMI